MTRDKIRAILKRVEWQSTSHANWRVEAACPDCGGPRAEGHEPGCMLHAALVDLACPECEGTGIIERSVSNGPHYESDVELMCLACNAGSHR